MYNNILRTNLLFKGKGTLLMSDSLWVALGLKLPLFHGLKVFRFLKYVVLVMVCFSFSHETKMPGLLRLVSWVGAGAVQGESRGPAAPQGPATAALPEGCQLGQLWTSPQRAVAVSSSQVFMLHCGHYHMFVEADSQKHLNRKAIFFSIKRHMANSYLG